MKITLFCCIAFFLPLFAQTQNFDIKNLHYLKGKWIINKNGTDIHEQWNKENDSLLISLSFYVKDGDTAYAETVRLEKIGEDVFYIPTVEHNAGPVQFKLTSFTKNKAVFENPSHDFPTKIIYEKINDDSLHASVEGIVGGKFKKIDYPFRRVK